VEWIQPAQDRDTFRVVMNVVMNGFHNTRGTCSSAEGSLFTVFTPM